MRSDNATWTHYGTEDFLVRFKRKGPYFMTYRVLAGILIGITSLHPDGCLVQQIACRLFPFAISGAGEKEVHKDGNKATWQPFARERFSFTLDGVMYSLTKGL